MSGNELRRKMEEALDVLNNARNIVLLGHINADGDVFGSMTALRHRMAQRGKNVFPILFDPVPDRYSYLDFGPNLKVYDPGDSVFKDIVSDADLFVVLDLSDADRLHEWSGIIDKQNAAVVCIDHHPGPGPPPGDVNVIDAGACATGELLYELFRLDGGAITREEALGLFTAIATDTGWFRYSNTSPKTLAISSELARCGIDLSEIYGYIYQSNDLFHVRLVGKAAGEVRFAMGGRLLWTTISKDSLKGSGTGEFHTEDLLDILRSVEKCRCVALFRETEDGEVKVNLRSKGSLEINRLAERFGGGGHKKAAGITMSGLELEDAEKKVIDAILEMMACGRSESDV